MSMYNTDHEATLAAAAILNESNETRGERLLAEKKEHDRKRMVEGISKMRSWLSTFGPEDRATILNSIR